MQSFFKRLAEIAKAILITAGGCLSGLLVVGAIAILPPAVLYHCVPIEVEEVDPQGDKSDEFEEERKKKIEKAKAERWQRWFGRASFTAKIPRRK